MYYQLELSLLSPAVLDNTIDKAAQTAVKQNYGALCVPPYWVKKASRETKSTDTQLFTVIGYPFGYQRTEAKQAEIELAFSDGVNGIELVLNLSAIKSDRMNWIKAEIARFAKLVHEKESLLTIIVDYQVLTENELVKVCKAVSEAGADFLKNHPFAEKSISMEEAENLRNLIHPTVGLKVYLKEKETQDFEDFFRLRAEKICIDFE